MNEVELEDMERVTLYTYVCSYLLLKERIQELYMFRIRSTRSSTSGSHNLVNSAKLKALFQSDCSKQSDFVQTQARCLGYFSRVFASRESSMGE